MVQMIRKDTGLTLIELTIAIALTAVAIGMSVIAIGAVQKSSAASRVSNDIAAISYGINEYVLIYKIIPSGTSWPAALNDFVKDPPRTAYTYKCDSSTGMRINLTSTKTYSSSTGNAVVSKLLDQSVCSSATYSTTSKTITCTPYAYKDIACQ